MARPYYSAAEHERRWRRTVRRRWLAFCVVAVAVAGNAALFLWRSEVVAFVRSTFGTYEIRIDRTDN